MTYKENITAILECYFTGFKDEIIESACNRILEQEPKTGHWKPFDLTFGRNVYYCTACQRSAEGNLFNYCPNCGAKMIEPQESENKE